MCKQDSHGVHAAVLEWSRLIESAADYQLVGSVLMRVRYSKECFAVSAIDLPRDYFHRCKHYRPSLLGKIGVMSVLLSTSTWSLMIIGGGTDLTSG